MKTRNAKVLCTLLICFAITLGVKAQHTQIIHNSSGSDAHIEVEETQNNDFARIFYKNSNGSEKWSTAGRLGTDFGQHDFGIFYEGFYRYLYDEKDKRTYLHQDLELVSEATNPSLDLDFYMNDGSGATATSFGNINWIDEVGGQFARIKGFSNQGGSAIPEYLSLSGGMGSGVGTNFMTMWKDYTTFSSSELAFCTSCGAGGRVSIVDNSGGTDQQLRIVEDNLTDYARIGFYNSGSADRWNIAARPAAADKALALSFNGDQALYLRGGVGRIGVNDSSPTANFHIKQIGTSEEGLAIENDANTNTWSWEIGTADLNIALNGVNKGFWNDADGVYTASDRRLKNTIAPMDKGVLSKLLSLNASTYKYNDVERDEETFGFIAQEVQEVFPEIVREFDDGSGLLAIAYSKVGVLAVEAIKEQQEIIEEQANEIKELKSQMESILERLEKLEE